MGYIVRCRGGALYVGSTIDLERRVAEHQQGAFARYTAIRLPVELVFCHHAKRLDEAFRLERQIKGWRRAKKLALIRGDYEALVELSRNHQEIRGC